MFRDVVQMIRTEARGLWAPCELAERLPAIGAEYEDHEDYALAVECAAVQLQAALHNTRALCEDDSPAYRDYTIERLADRAEELLKLIGEKEA